MMDAPTFDATKFVRPALLSVIFYFFVVLISSMAVAKSAQASGTLWGSLSTFQYSVSVWVTAVNTNPGTLNPVFVYTSTPISCSAYSFAVLALCVEAAAGGPVYSNDYYRNYVGGNPQGFTDPIAGHVVCPANSTLSSANICTCTDPYVPDTTTGTSCVSACPVDQLSPLDPAVQPYEDGLIDMDNETQATRDGAACIVRVGRARRPRIYSQIKSGYRPPAYQTHIREVYDKWQLLENNNDPACADTKRKVKTEFVHHSHFAHQPGTTSRHSSKTAVDISLSNYTEADAIAAECNMSRPVPNDRPHFESPR